MGSPATDRELVRRGGLIKFVQLAWRHVPAQYGDAIIEPHMDLICRHYEAVSRGELKELVVNVPPGCSKSMITNVLWPAWDWIEKPWRKWMFTSYSEDLALRDAGFTMELVQSEWFRARWGDLFTVQGGDKAAKRYFLNDKGGSRFSTSMGGAATGMHAHFLVCDDPVKPADIQAGGDPAREALEKCNTRWSQTFSSRSADAATFARVVIMQRLHALDLAGVMAKNGAQVLSLPMEFEPHRKYESEWGDDWRTEEGELLAPKRFPREVIEKRRGEMSLRDWAAQYQQRPSPEDGAIFLRSFFDRRWTILPRMSKTILSVDATFKEKKKSDFFCVQLLGLKSSTEFYLIDQMKQRTGFWGGIELIKQMQRKWPAAGQVVIEDRANGSAIIETLQKSMTGVVAVTPRGGKESRANAAEPLYRSNLWFPHDSLAPWMEDYVDSHLAFPVGEYDDEVDCTTQGVLFLQGKTGGAILAKAMENYRKGYMPR
jgi:predicted phage terminase large subunit-like protein